MVRSKKTGKPDQLEGSEFTDTVRGRSILRAIKKYLGEQPKGMGRYGKILNYVVADKGIISDKGFKNHFSQFVQEGKVEPLKVIRTGESQLRQVAASAFLRNEHWRVDADDGREPLGDKF